MNYYFYSKQKGLIGLINYRLVEKSLYNDKSALLKNIKEKGEVSGYIYTCRAKEGKFFNNAYKTPHPLEIIGCDKMENLL